MSMRHISECLPALGGVPLRPGARTEGKRVADQHRRSSDTDFLAAAKTTMNTLSMRLKREGYSVAEVQTFMSDFIEGAASRRSELTYERHASRVPAGV